MDWLTPVLARIDNVALLVVVALYIMERRENRADRQALMDLLFKTTEAMHGLRNAFTALTGRPLQ